MVKYSNDKTNNIKKLAFSGIQVISPDIFENMPDKEVFSVIDLYLKLATYLKITAYIHNNDFWFDLGKKETIQEAEKFLFTINNKLLNM
ncbi:MAG TPA: hypothetical protein P5250_04170 [Bacteroidales bacterium]|nr:hypothetical protein [Bacteroidales bacterium]